MLLNEKIVGFQKSQKNDVFIQPLKISSLQPRTEDLNTNSSNQSNIKLDPNEFDYSFSLSKRLANAKPRQAGKVQFLSFSEEDCRHPQNVQFVNFDINKANKDHEIPQSCGWIGHSVGIEKGKSNRNLSSSLSTPSTTTTTTTTTSSSSSSLLTSSTTSSLLSTVFDDIFYIYSNKILEFYLFSSTLKSSIRSTSTDALIPDSTTKYNVENNHLIFDFRASSSSSSICSKIQNYEIYKFCLSQEIWKEKFAQLSNTNGQYEIAHLFPVYPNKLVIVFEKMLICIICIDNFKIVLESLFKISPSYDYAVQSVLESEELDKEDLAQRNQIGHYSIFCCFRNYLFTLLTLDSVNDVIQMIEIWDFQGKVLIGEIKLDHVMKSKSEFSNQKFLEMKVSPDGLLLFLRDENGLYFKIDIDGVITAPLSPRFPQLFKVTAEEISELNQADNDKEMDNDGQMIASQYHHTNMNHDKRNLCETSNQHWFNSLIPNRYCHEEKHDNLLICNDTGLLNFPTLDGQDLIYDAARSICIVSNTSFTNTITWALTSDFLIVLGEVKNDKTFRALYLYNNREDEGGMTYLPDDTHLLVASDQNSFTIIHLDDGLYMYGFGRSRDQILNELVLFKGREYAYKICELNGWDPRALTIHALQSGLRNRELVVIEDALSNIDESQEILGGCILAHFISTTLFPKDSDFKIQLIRVALHFVTQMIEKRYEKMGECDNSPKRDDTQCDAAIVFNNQKIVGVENKSHSSAFKSFDLNYGKWADFLQQQLLSKKTIEIYDFEELELLNNIILTLRSFLVGENYSETPGDNNFNFGNLQGNLHSSQDENQERDVIDDNESDSDNEILLTNDSFLFQQHPKIYKKWQAMSDREVITDSLKEGLISLAFSFLKSKYLSNSKRDSEVTDFNSFKAKAYRVIFDYFSRYEFDTALLMLDNIGEDVVDHMREITFLTADVSLRNQLIRELKRKQAFSNEDLGLITFLHSLEKLYGLSSFWKAFRQFFSNEHNHRPKMSNDQYKKVKQMKLEITDANVSPIDNLLLFGNINDLAQFVNTDDEKKNILQDVSGKKPKEDVIGRKSKDAKTKKVTFGLKSGIATSKKSKKSPHGEYLYLPLEWVKSWNADIRERVLIERGKHLENRKSDAKLSYYISHNDLNGMVNWIHNLELPRNCCIDIDKNEINFKTVDNLEQKEQSECNLKAIISLLDSEISIATSFLKEVSLTSLAKRGILITSEMDNFSSKLRRLAKAALLFSTGHKTSIDIESILSQHQETLPTSSSVSMCLVLPSGTLSTFHKKFIQKIISLNLPSLFEKYLDTYDLWDATNEYLTLEQKRENLWIAISLLSRQKHQFFETSLINAKKVSNLSSDNMSLHKLFTHDKLLMGLATLAYSPVPIQESLTASISNPYYISPSKFSDLIANFPRFHSAVFRDNVVLNPDLNVKEKEKFDAIIQSLEVSKGNLSTFEKDITLYEMIIDTHQELNVEQILGMDTGDELTNFDSHSLTSFRHSEELDLEYYLTQGRPTDAYENLISQKGEADFFERCLYDENNPNSLDLPPEKQKEIEDQVRKIALSNFLDKKVSASARAFLEMCHIDSHKILIDVKAARRIFKYHDMFKACNGEMQQRETLHQFIKRIVYIKDDCKDDGSSSDEGDNDIESSKIAILKLLEEATETKVREITQMRDKTFTHQLPLYNPSSTTFTSPYQLIHLFSSIHGLPIYVKHLERYAKNNQWISLLFDAQTQNTPLQILIQIIKDNIADYPLQEHLLNVLKTLDPLIGLGDLSTNPSDKNERMQLFNVILRAEEMKGEEASLLLIEKAIDYQQPLLAVIASHYSEIYNIRCLITYLLACYQKLISDPLEMKGTSKKVPRSFTGESNIDKENQKKEELQELQVLIERFCSKKHISAMTTLIRAWEIFDESNPMIAFLEFYKNFLEYKFTESEKNMRLFISAKNKKSPQYLIGNDEWIYEVSNMLTNKLSSLLDTGYQRQKFLEMLNNAGYEDGRFARLYKISCILSSINFELLSNDYDINILEDNKQNNKMKEIVQLLIRLKYFDQARKIAAITYPSGKELTREITKEQALCFVHAAHESPIWDYEEERTKIWIKVNHLFVTHDYEQEKGGNFFMDHLYLYHKDLPLHECISMLVMALNWYKGKVELDQMMTSSIKDRPQVMSKPCKSKEDLDFLEHNISLLMKCSQAIQSGTVTSFNPSYISSIITTVCSRFREKDNKKGTNIGNGNEEEKQLNGFVDSIIDSLMNEGNIEEAERLCQYFKHTNMNLEIAKTATDLARHKIATKQIPKHVKELLQEYFSDGEDTFEYSTPTISETGEISDNKTENEMQSYSTEVQQLIDRFCFLCRGVNSKGARHYLKIVGLNYRIATTLQLSYDNIVSRDEYEILKFLLMYGKEMYKICSQFITLRKLDTEKAAIICADFLFSQFCEFYVAEELHASGNPTGNVQQNLGETFEKEDSSENTEEGDTDSESSESSSWTVSTTGSSQNTPSRRGSANMDVNTATPIALSAPLSISHELVQCSMDDFTEFAALSHDPHSLAVRVLELLDEDKEIPPKATLQCRVELIARAYWCFRIASSLDGIEDLMKKIKEELVPILINEHKFSLIVRLIVSLRNYAELDYLFDILMKHEQFELILRRDTQRTLQLKMILANYLRTKYPTDDEKLMMVYLRFNMYSALGSILMKKGRTGIIQLSEQLNQLISGKPSNPFSMSSQSTLFNNGSKEEDSAPQSLEERIKRVAQYFQSAADAFTKDECYQTAAKCISMGNLLELQHSLYQSSGMLEKPTAASISSSFSFSLLRSSSTSSKNIQNSNLSTANIVVINLTKQEARQFMKTHDTFINTMIVAAAYDLTMLSEWIEPIYHQCITKGNTSYFEAFREYFPAPTSLFKEITKRFRMDNQNNLTTNQMIQSMKAFLQLCQDTQTQSQIAKELGFRSLA